MELLEISAVHDSSKLGELYRVHAPRALGLAYLLAGDWHQAEDLAQEAFVRVAGRFRHIRDPGVFEAYLRRAVINLHRSFLRRRRLEREYLSRQAVVDRAGSMPDIESRDELVAALLRVPQRQRAAVVLRHCLDLTESQVADALGCSVAAARNLVARGLKVLRAELGGDDT